MVHKNVLRIKKTDYNFYKFITQKLTKYIYGNINISKINVLKKEKKESKDSIFIC